MRRAGGLIFLGLLLTTAVAGANTAGCSVQKGLYEEWLSLSKRSGSPRKVLKLLGASTASGTPDAATEQKVGEEYQVFFQCLSTVSQKEEKSEQSFCEEAAGDRLATVVCQTVLYVKAGRIGSKEFVDALPGGKKGAEMIWDLDAIAGVGQKKPASIFAPKGPAYKLIDELFVLVLDDKEAAVSKYFNIAGSASDAGAKYMDGQIKVLMLESPAVVVKQWSVVRQYLPRIKKLLAEAPPADLRRIRQGVAAFCTKDNLDCPEIQKTFGRAE
jgi:hypothetical protein